MKHVTGGRQGKTALNGSLGVKMKLIWIFDSGTGVIPVMDACPVPGTLTFFDASQHAPEQRLMR
ncbi:hypothetical protein [Sorangium cellulosum]|uniref:hypothetical protein n=1 Tax=Sorangium cellulosum TaxID=56 RepID=UPI001331B755|nr:hypothetical protein [Sorangium cellulosum]